MKKLDKTLIIGIGNNTRKDDGLGWSFLEKLEKNGFNPDHLLCKYQLMVEDAEVIAEYNTVIFIDACKARLDEGFMIEEIYPAKEVAFSTHSVPPNQVLNLCKTIYNKTPKAYVVKIEGVYWDIEVGLSQRAEQNLKNAFHYFEQCFLPEKVS